MNGVKGFAKGGTATATTSISNSGNIYSGIGPGPTLGSDGIVGISIASANGFLVPNIFVGNGTGGTAKATTTITNSGTLSGGGIVGLSFAFALGSQTGGTAIAITNITNTGSTIITLWQSCGWHHRVHHCSCQWRV